MLSTKTKPGALRLGVKLMEMRKLFERGARVLQWIGGLVVIIIAQWTLWILCSKPWDAEELAMRTGNNARCAIQAYAKFIYNLSGQ